MNVRMIPWMASFRSTTVLPVRPEIAWQFVVEHGHEVEVIEFEPRGPQSVGVLNDIRVRVFGLSFGAVSSTVAWDPPSTCAFESVRPSWPVTTHITEEFRPLDGETEHIIDYEVSARGVVGSVVAPIFCRMMKRNRHQYQERLRIALARCAGS